MRRMVIDLCMPVGGGGSLESAGISPHAHTLTDTNTSTESEWSLPNISPPPPRLFPLSVSVLVARWSDVAVTKQERSRSKAFYEP